MEHKFSQRPNLNSVILDTMVQHFGGFSVIVLFTVLLLNSSQRRKAKDKTKSLIHVFICVLLSTSACMRVSPGRVMTMVRVGARTNLL